MDFMDEEEDYPKMTNKIKNARKEKNLTQAELAKKIGTTAQTVSRLEKGDLKLTVSRVQDIAEALGCDPSDLLFATKKGNDIDAKLLETFRDMNSEQKVTMLHFLQSLSLDKE